MRSIVAPSHPLIQAFLLQRGAFGGIKNIIVESDTDALKLKNTLDALTALQKGEQRAYQVISSHTDILRTLHYPETIGIYTTPIALNPPINRDQKNTGMLTLVQDMLLTEKELIGWLTENGYETKKSTDTNTYIRQGDTISIQTTRGLLQVSFLSGKIEAIYLDTQPVQNYTLISAL